MSESWLDLLDSVLRPSRPYLDACLRGYEVHLQDRRRKNEERNRARVACERRIEDARAEIFAADTGVVTKRMGELEREWLRLSKPDHDGDLMDLWARIAPSTWIDQKRFRGGDSDLAIALAADPEGVERAEKAAAELRRVLPNVGPKIRWRLVGDDHAVVTSLLPRPEVVSEMGTRIERRVLDAARTHLGPGLAADLAQAAFVDSVVKDRAATKALRALWATGYTLGDVDETGITLETIGVERERARVDQAAH